MASVPVPATRPAMYWAHARSSSARPSSPVTTNVARSLPYDRSSRAVASATTKLAHSTSDDSLTARAPTVPAVVFCTTDRPVRSRDRSMPGELTVSNPGAGGPSLSATQSGRAALSASASSSDSARTICSAPWAKAQAATVKARMTSATTATGGVSVRSAMPRKRVSMRAMIGYGRPWARGARRRAVR
ncbi:hypothetical protein HNQ79_005802 [Streptomyces candidus]|uniref:Uncharacterized protein n=1 Tax=Streptomyces candidus TaxID=67283 RepID=A0A7X0LSI4_9ACTN|nr:hypothetical protein [Streptomyces candidus]